MSHRYLGSFFLRIRNQSVVHGRWLRCGQAGWGNVLFSMVKYGGKVLWCSLFSWCYCLVGQGSGDGIYHEITSTSKNSKPWRKWSTCFLHWIFIEECLSLWKRETQNIYENCKKNTSTWNVFFSSRLPRKTSLNKPQIQKRPQRNWIPCNSGLGTWTFQVHIKHLLIYTSFGIDVCNIQM